MMNFVVSLEKRQHYIDKKIEEMLELQNNILNAELPLALQVESFLAFLHKFRGGAKTFGFQILGDAAGALEKSIVAEYAEGQAVDVQQQIALLLTKLKEAKLRCD